MGDLISRDFSVNALREYAEQKHAVGQTELANGILKAINFLGKKENVPTAYDVEKVVAELEEQRKIEEKVSKECLVEFKNMHIYARNCFGVAITKVRNGGKE